MNEEREMLSLELLEKYFGVKPEATIQTGKHMRYVANNLLYTIVPVTHLEQEILIELYEMSEHMAKLSDRNVSTFVAAQDGHYLVTVEEQDYVLLVNRYRQAKRKKNIGLELAKFHERGKTIPIEVQTVNRLGKWKDYWVTRLEQMEREWSKMAREQPREKFDKLFVESFPYFLGLAENAIQYVVDTEMDEQPLPTDLGTICHEYFHDSLWQDELHIRNPFDWVFDHPARDIAEWIRAQYFSLNHTTFLPDLQTFLAGYESIVRLSPFAWRLIYARLLFPLHYFTIVETYFSTESQWTQKQQEEKLTRLLRDTKDYELFLRKMHQIAESMGQTIPPVDWL